MPKLMGPYPERQTDAMSPNHFIAWKRQSLHHFHAHFGSPCQTNCCSQRCHGLGLATTQLGRIEQNSLSRRVCLERGLLLFAKKTKAWDFMPDKVVRDRMDLAATSDTFIRRLHAVHQDLLTSGYMNFDECDTLRNFACKPTLAGGPGERILERRLVCKGWPCPI
jgi:hypothetical protein